VQRSLPREADILRPALDQIQRQIENVRFVGSRIDRVTISSQDGEAVVSYVRAQPEEGRKRSPSGTRRAKN
jgi:hypothetical protein